VNFDALPPIIAAVIYLLTGFFVYSREKPNAVNKSFAILLLCVSLWNVERAGLTIATDPHFANLWGDIFRLGLIFIPATFLDFTLRFTNIYDTSSQSRKILQIFYAVSCSLGLIQWSWYFHGDVVKNALQYRFQGGPLYSLFILEFISAIVLSFYYLFQGYHSADRYERHKLKYFFIAAVISFSMGSLDFLPKLGLQVYHLGTIAIAVGLWIAAYSVIQHRMMDVGVFMAKSLAYLLSFSILSAIAFLSIRFLEKDLLPVDPFPFVGIMIPIGIAGIILFNFLKNRIDRTLQDFFVRDRYKYHDILEDFSRRLLTIVDLNRLIQMLAETIERAMGIRKISLFLMDQEKNGFTPVTSRGLPENEFHSILLRDKDFPISLLRERKEAVLVGELFKLSRKREVAPLSPLLEKLEAEVYLPLLYLNKMIGFISLGQKANGEMYYPDDLNLLNYLGSQTAIAIENANLYENLKRSQGILRRADRLAALGTLIASLAHEIRNPLVSIKTFTQLLPERIEDEEFRTYFLKVASSEIDRLTSLINELLGFARPSDPNLRGENVNEIIERMEFLIATEARKKNIQITKNYAADLPSVLVDAEQIKQVLLNVLLNAIQAIPGEGQIWVETRLVFIARDRDPTPFVQIEIRDTGVGIPQENYERIFDPFFSTRPEGSGLGMAISNQIVHEHGGFIDLESEVGKGTSFRIHLPLEPEKRSDAIN
jgi:two-component system NtrC family sensor kinase